MILNLIFFLAAVATPIIGMDFLAKFELSIIPAKPEFVDPVFTKTRPKRSFSMTENEQFGLVFAQTGSINSGTGPARGLGPHLHQGKYQFFC